MSCTGNLLSSLTLTPDSSLIDPPRWYAVYTYPRHEKSVLEHFESKSLEAFFPHSLPKAAGKTEVSVCRRPSFLAMSLLESM